MEIIQIIFKLLEYLILFTNINVLLLILQLGLHLNNIY